MITGVEHIAIYAKDSTALKDWYQKLFDFELVYDNNKGTYFLKVADGTTLEICQQTEEAGEFTPTKGGVRHIAFYVDDFEEMVDRIKAAGAEVVTDAKVSASGVKTFFFKDLDGNIMHLINRATPLF